MTDEVQYTCTAIISGNKDHMNIAKDVIRGIKQLAPGCHVQIMVEEFTEVE